MWGDLILCYVFIGYIYYEICKEIVGVCVWLFWVLILLDVYYVVYGYWLGWFMMVFNFYWIKGIIGWIEVEIY